MSQGLEVLVFLVYLVFLVSSGGFCYSFHFGMVLPCKALVKLAGESKLFMCSPKGNVCFHINLKLCFGKPMVFNENQRFSLVFLRKSYDFRYFTSLQEK